MIFFATFCFVVSLIIIFLQKGLWEKILATNITVSLVIILIVLVGLKTGISYYLDIAFAFGLLSFIGTQFFARFLAAREEELDD